MHHPTDRIIHTTAFVTPVVEHWLERDIAQWVHPMKDRSNDPSHHERTLLPRSTSRFLVNGILFGVMTPISGCSGCARNPFPTMCRKHPFNISAAIAFIKKPSKRSYSYFGINSHKRNIANPIAQFLFNSRYHSYTGR